MLVISCTENLAFSAVLPTSETERASSSNTALEHTNRLPLSYEAISTDRVIEQLLETECFQCDWETVVEIQGSPEVVSTPHGWHRLSLSPRLRNFLSASALQHCLVYDPIDKDNHSGKYQYYVQHFSDVHQCNTAWWPANIVSMSTEKTVIINDWWTFHYFASSPPGCFATTQDDWLPGHFDTRMFHYLPGVDVLPLVWQFVAVAKRPWR